MPVRQSNNPKRRIEPADRLDPAFLRRLVQTAHYAGSPHHKRTPADYGFNPPANPRPNKSLCDGAKIIKRAEAALLFVEGIRRGMISRHREGDLPKYVWSLDSREQVYEAKINRGTRSYHGYQLGDDDTMQRLVAREWRKRYCII